MQVWIVFQTVYINFSNDPSLNNAFVDSSSYATNRHKSHFGTGCGASVLIFPPPDSEPRLYTATGPPTTTIEQSISLTCLCIWLTHSTLVRCLWSMGLLLKNARQVTTMIGFSSMPQYCSIQKTLTVVWEVSLYKLSAVLLVQTLPNNQTC